MEISDGKEILRLARGTPDIAIMDLHIVPVTLRAGSNVLIVKTGTVGGHVRVTQKDGTPLPGISYSIPDVPPQNRAKSTFLKD